MVKQNLDPITVYAMIDNGDMDEDGFMCWYHSIKTKAYSEGYKEASDNAYKNGGGFEF